MMLAACGKTPPQSAAQPAAPIAPAEHHHHDRHHNHGGMAHRFEDADQWAKTFDDPARDAWQEPDRVLAMLALAPGMTVADIGAGTGYFAVRIARALPTGRVLATDIEPDMIRYLRERAGREQLTNLEPVLATADDPKVTDVDRILVVDVWHHLPDRIAYAKRLANALRDGGLIAVVDFKLDATMGPPKEFRLAPQAIIDDLTAAGLSAQLAGQLREQYVVIARRRPATVRP